MGIAHLLAYVIVRHKLAVCSCITCTCADGSNLVVDLKNAGLRKVGKILCTVIFEIAAFIVHTPDKQLVHLSHVTIQFR